MSGTIIPTLYRTVSPVAADPDWAGTQTIPTVVIRLERLVSRIGVVAVAEDDGGVAVAGTLDLQAVVISRTIGDPDRLNLVAGSAVEPTPVGTMYVIDASSLATLAVRIVNADVPGAARVKLYWRVLR